MKRPERDGHSQENFPAPGGQAAIRRVVRLERLKCHLEKYVRRNGSVSHVHRRIVLFEGRIQRTAQTVFD